MNIYFLLALLASLAGPLLYHVVPYQTKAFKFMDGMILAALLGLICLHIVPESLEHLGFVTFIAVILGLLGPVLFSKLTRKNECEIQKPFLMLTALGFIAHNILDGAALVIHPDEHKSTHLLALAVVAHRILMSMALWQTSYKNFGLFKSIVGLIGLCIAMSMGYFFSDQLFTRMHADILHILQSVSCGMLFHVLLHPHHIKQIFKDTKSIFSLNSQSIGALCGLLVAIIVYLYWPSHIHTH